MPVISDDFSMTGQDMMAPGLAPAVAPVRFFALALPPLPKSWLDPLSAVDQAWTPPRKCTDLAMSARPSAASSTRKTVAPSQRIANRPLIGLGKRLLRCWPLRCSPNRIVGSDDAASVLQRPGCHAMSSVFAAGTVAVSLRIRGVVDLGPATSDVEHELAGKMFAGTEERIHSRHTGDVAHTRDPIYVNRLASQEHHAGRRVRR
jgi:hypothetical protein